MGTILAPFPVVLIIHKQERRLISETLHKTRNLCFLPSGMRYLLRGWDGAITSKRESAWSSVSSFQESVRKEVIYPDEMQSLGLEPVIQHCPLPDAAVAFQNSEQLWSRAQDPHRALTGPL